MSAGGKARKVALPSQSRDRIAALFGISGRTLEKIRAIDGAKDEPPELFERMEQSGKVDGTYRPGLRAGMPELAQQREEVRKGDGAVRQQLVPRVAARRLPARSADARYSPASGSGPSGSSVAGLPIVLKCRSTARKSSSVTDLSRLGSKKSQKFR